MDVSMTSGAGRWHVGFLTPARACGSDGPGAGSGDRPSAGDGWRCKNPGRGMLRYMYVKGKVSWTIYIIA